MNDITATIKHAINQELERSMELYPCSNNPHGAYFVIKEELTEVFDELDNIKDKMEELEKIIFKAKGHPHLMTADEVALIHGLEIDAIDAIVEMIQVAAMCKKYKKAFTYTSL